MKPSHDDIIKWKHFLGNWPLVRGIHWSPVNFHHKGQWCVALMFSLICAWINGWVNNREAGDLEHHRADYDVIVLIKPSRYSLCPMTRLLGIVTYGKTSPNKTIILLPYMFDNFDIYDHLSVTSLVISLCEMIYHQPFCCIPLSFVK